MGARIDTGYVCKYEYDDIDIAGSQYYDTSLVQDGDEVILSPEPDNKYDPHAVAVIHNGNTIGYLPKNTLQDMYHDYIKRNGKVTAIISSSKKMQMQLRYLLAREHEDSETEEIEDDRFTVLFDEKIIRSLNDSALNVYTKDVLFLKENHQDSKYEEAQIDQTLSIIQDEIAKRWNGRPKTKKRSIKKGYLGSAIVLAILATIFAVQSDLEAALGALLICALFSFLSFRKK